MMSLLGPLAAPSAQTAGEPGGTPAPEAGFGDLVDAMQIPEAAPVALPETGVLLEGLEGAEPLPEGEELDLVPLAEPVPVPMPVPVAVHTVVAELQPPRPLASDSPPIGPADAAEADAPPAPMASKGAVEAPPPALVAGDPPADAPDAEPGLVLAKGEWMRVAPTVLEARPALATSAEPGAQGAPLPHAAERAGMAPAPSAPIVPAPAGMAGTGDVVGKPEGVAAAPVDAPGPVAGMKSQDETPVPREGARRAARFGVSVERVGSESVSPANVSNRPEPTANEAAVEPATAPIDRVAGEPYTDAPVRGAVAAAEGREALATAPAAAEGLAGARLDGPSEQARPAVPLPAAPEPATLAKAAAPPRSPLVQAALDRVLPLPSLAGETVVRLNPAGLGLIEVVVQESRDGALDVALRVQNPMVLEAMRQEQAAVGQAIAAAQGGAAGSLSMDLFQSGTGQRGTEGEAHTFHTAGSEAGGESADAPADEPALQIVREDRVNIVT